MKENTHLPRGAAPSPRLSSEWEGLGGSFLKATLAPASDSSTSLLWVQGPAAAELVPGSGSRGASGVGVGGSGRGAGGWGGISKVKKGLLVGPGEARASKEARLL